MAPRLLFRLMGGVGDQGALALFSIILLAVSSHALTAEQFGTFALLNGTYIFIQAISQACFSEATVVALSRENNRTDHPLIANVLRQAWLMATLICLLSMSALAMLTHFGPSTIVLFSGVVFCGVVLDALRGSLIAGRLPLVSAANSMTMLGVLIISVLVFGVPESVNRALMYWLVATTLPLMCAICISMRSWRKTAGCGHEGQSSPLLREIRTTLLGEAVLASAGQYTALLAVDAFVGREQVGSLRLAMAMFGPVSVVLNVIRLNGLAELAAAGKALSRRVLAFRVGVGCGLAAVALGIILSVIPDRLGGMLLGESWAGAKALLWWAAGHRVSVGWSMGPSIVLRQLHVLRSPLIVRAYSNSLGVGLTAVGSWFAGPEGALTGMSAGVLIQVAGLWFILDNLDEGGKRRRCV